MKKVVALLMAAVMTVGMATVAFAAPSPAATTGTVKEAVDANGKSIELVASDNYAKADQAAAAEIKSDAQAVLKKVVPSVNAADYKLAMLKDVAYVGEGTPVFPVKVTLNVDGVTAASKVIVLHYVNGAWQQETAVAGNGTHGGFSALKNVMKQSINALKYHKNVIIMPAENGLRIFAPILLILNVIFHRKLHYVVIGGWLPQFLKNRKCLSFFLKKFDYIYVEANDMKVQLEKKGFNNVFVVPNCKELVILKNEDLVYDETEPYKLCTFSRVMKEKGIEDAVNAVNKINKLENRRVFILDIYGQIDKNQEEWFEKLQSMFPDFIRYGGLIPYDKSTDVLKNYFALLFPTYYEGEGFAGTLIDAMAAGVPVIASDWKYNKEIVEDGKTGIIMHNSLEKELLNILQEKEQWMRMKKLCVLEAKKYLPSVALQPLIENLN